ncbi:hypothetical protein BWI96_14715 [Siphonobacter sp. SORGH_AS_0500]|uniref:hypothetical protein n=1 Tax=Siphonobacter sp. SORGH_AS_0500 TaxID=1864824 RepID=UPI000CAD4C9D|nr:hypothetical protein [Siphonobacter sp. SORGH_AS_0500]PKK35783.1 hypothetical protein BWI96_14715 [Siphonobacter sp. SORGH_AS_0500]
MIYPKNLRRFFSMGALVMLLIPAAEAQVAFSLHGTLAAPTLDDANTRGGAGANLKLFLGKQFAIGAAAKYISLSYEANNSIGLQAIGSLIPVTATADYYLTSGFIRPYIGGEAGAYIQRYDLRQGTNSLYESKTTRFGAAPKVGLAIAIGNLGVFAEGNYHFIFSNKDGSPDITSSSNISFKRPQNLWSLNAGITFGFPNSN